MGMLQDIFADGPAVTLDGKAGNAARDVTPSRLTSQQKAAVIVRLLLGQGVSPGVAKLPTRHQAKLAHTISGLGHIDRATLAEVVRDFTHRIDNLALSFPENLSQTLEILSPFLADGVRDNLTAQAELGSDPWSRVSKQPVSRLRPLLDSESAEVCSVLLSKLSVAKAAELLSDLSEERAQILAYTVSLTETITPDLVERIGAHVATILDAQPTQAFTKTAAERIGAILNSTPQAARDMVLDGLNTRSAPFASDVRKSIFAFPHIAMRLKPGDAPLVVRKVDAETLSVAIAAGLSSAPLSVEFLLENISKRLAEQLRDEAEGLGTPKPAEGEAAMADVVAVIRDLEAAGEISLLPPPED